MARFIVLYDACVLYPAPLRDLLMRLAVAEVVQAKWTEEILDETFRNIQKNRPELDPRRLQRTRELMCEAVPDCLIHGYESLKDGLTLPDADDRHVLAAAVRAGAQTIVTANTRDFPVAALEPYEIEALHPDDFIRDLLDLAPGTVLTVLKEQADALRNPPRTLEDLVDTLEDVGLVRSMTAARSMLRLDG